ncbi:hypothetical protein D3C77_641010 [compost metagenome]
MVNIDSKQVVALQKSDPNYPIEEIQSWVKENIQEIMRCWDSALESFYRFYPEKRVV